MVFDLKRFALHDGPGIRTTVFLKGCPLSCAWCHNPESQRTEPELLFWEDRCTGCGACVTACPVEAVAMAGEKAATDRARCTACGACVPACPEGARAIAGAEWSTDDLVQEIERDLLFFDQSGGGVTLSGGEPLAQVAFAHSILTACAKRRIHTAVDTCGYGAWEDLAALAEVTDLFLYDVKQTDDELHIERTGRSNRPILENLERLDGMGRPIWIRCPLVPGYNDDRSTLDELAAIVKNLSSVRAVHVLPFHRGGQAKSKGLGRECEASQEGDAHAAANAAAEILRLSVGVPVHVGG